MASPCMVRSRQVAAASTPAVTAPWRGSRTRHRWPARPCAGRTGRHASSQRPDIDKRDLPKGQRPCLGRTGPFRIVGRTRSQTLAIVPALPCRPGMPRNRSRRPVCFRLAVAGGHDGAACTRQRRVPGQNRTRCLWNGSDFFTRRPAQDHKPMIHKELLSWHEICFIPTADQPKGTHSP